MFKTLINGNYGKSLLIYIYIGRLINPYFIITIVIHKNEKKNTYINIAFHNFKIECTRIKTELTFQNY